MFKVDTKLNISTAYLRPGGAFGGPCLPKDVLALSSQIKGQGVSAPVIDNILASNTAHTGFLLSEIRRRVVAGGRILLIGLAFKASTSDVRGSPSTALADLLADDGYDLRVFDGDLESQSFDVLPPSLHSRIVSRRASIDAWDLVVSFKFDGALLASLPATVPVFHIDRF
jgi:GDP-mannose 6-dehydrogenase